MMMLLKIIKKGGKIIMGKIYDFDDFDIDLYEEKEGKGGSTSTQSISAGVSVLTSFTSATNSGTSISCAIATNVTEYKCRTCNGTRIR